MLLFKKRLVIKIISVLSLFLSTYVYSNKWVSKSKPAQIVSCNQRLDQTILKEAKEMLKNMTLEDKVGQMLMVKIEALNKNAPFDEINNEKSEGIKSIDSINLNINDYRVGGVILFHKNIENETQLIKLITDLQKASTIPLFIAIDEEGGSVSRLSNHENFELINYGFNESIGQKNDSKYAKNVASYIAEYLKNYGFNLNFAPVADINSNPVNNIIGNRAFSDDSKIVYEMVNSQIQGFHCENIISTIKHYPGHGDTTNDTHNETVYLNKSLNQIKSQELIPFLYSMHQTDMILASHITLPQLDILPSSISPVLIKDILRDAYGYKGIVITDALDMKAIINLYTTKEVIQYGLNAGVDLFLMPYDLQEAYNTLYEYGLYDEERINESVLKILYLKIKYDII